MRLTHPGRPIYPALDFSKRDLAGYYESIGEWVVPHVAGRPLTLVHCPNGMLGRCAYMRHAKVWGPSVLRRVRIQEKTKLGEYLVADSIEAVLGLVQMGVVEIHTWNSTIDRVEYPNRIVWDLDPGPDVKWTQVVAAARQLREMLRVLGLQSWVKTTGGYGVHVVAPIEPRHEWSACLAFARAVAAALVTADPSIYTIAFEKKGREKKILIDYLRNNRTNTSVAAYSSRARPGGTVSTPIAWRELGPRLRPEQFTVRTVPRRLHRSGKDPWQDYHTAKQRITPQMVAAVEAL